jgi:DegV family protein with EDD domain
MSEFIVATVSTADMEEEYMHEHNIPFLMYPYTVGKEVLMDDCKKETRDLTWKLMRAGELTTTSMINTYTYFELFDNLMQQGKDVLFLEMSDKLSRSYNNAVEAAKMLEEKHYKNRFYLMNTLCMSGGLGLLLHYVRIMRDEGKTLDETVEWAEANKLKIMHWFTVQDLNFLKRGGRVSNSAAWIGTLLNIKPVLYTNSQGALVALEKERGRKRALASILNHMKEDFTEPDGKEVFINHADCLEDAEFMRDKIKEMFPTVGKITVMSLGAVIGAHCGPGLLTIFYLGKARYK